MRRLGTSCALHARPGSRPRRPHTSPASRPPLVCPARHPHHQPATMSGEGQGTHKTPNDPVKEQIAQDKVRRGEMRGQARCAHASRTCTPCTRNAAHTFGRGWGVGWSRCVVRGLRAGLSLTAERGGGPRGEIGPRRCVERRGCVWHARPVAGACSWLAFCSAAASAVMPLSSRCTHQPTAWLCGSHAPPLEGAITHPQRCSANRDDVIQAAARRACACGPPCYMAAAVQQCLTCAANTHIVLPTLRSVPPQFGKSYDELTAHERIQVGGTKGGITTKEGEYGGHYQGEVGALAGGGGSAHHPCSVGRLALAQAG